MRIRLPRALKRLEQRQALKDVLEHVLGRRVFFIGQGRGRTDIHVPEIPRNMVLPMGGLDDGDIFFEDPHEEMSRLLEEMEFDEDLHHINPS